jgi:hypothetical protein
MLEEGIDQHPEHAQPAFLQNHHIPFLIPFSLPIDSRAHLLHCYNDSKTPQALYYLNQPNKLSPLFLFDPERIGYLSQFKTVPTDVALAADDLSQHSCELSLAAVEIEVFVLFQAQDE